MSYRYISDEYDPEPPDLPSPAELALDNRDGNGRPLKWGELDCGCSLAYGHRRWCQDHKQQENPS